MADKRFRGRDKIVQKMTKDGLVDENLRTGEQKSATAEEKLEKEDSAKETAEKETDEETNIGIVPDCRRGVDVVRPAYRAFAEGEHSGQHYRLSTKF